MLSGLWELPIGKGQKIDFSNGFLNTVLGGWQINTVTTIVGRAPLVVRGANNGLANRPDLLRTPDLPDGFTDPNPERGVLRFDTLAFKNPALYTYGNTPRAISQFRNSGAGIVDLSIFKNFSLTERVKLQFRAEAFNAPKHTNLGFPNTTFAPFINAQNPNDPRNGFNNNDAFRRITSSREPRQMQFGLKLTF